MNAAPAVPDCAPPVTPAVADRVALLLKWRRFVHRLARRYYRWAHPIDRRAAGVEDFAQDITTVAVRRLATYDPARGGMGTWLGWLARSLAAQRRRKALAPKRARRVASQSRADGSNRLDDLPAPAEPGGPDLPSEERLRAALEELTPRQRDAVRKRFGLGGEPEHGYADIDPGRCLEANRQLVERGLARLREVLGGG